MQKRQKSGRVAKRLPKRRTSPVVRNSDDGAPNEYSAFVGSLELIGLALIESEMKIDRTRFFKDKKEEVFVRITGKATLIEKDYFELEPSIFVKSSKSEKTDGSLKISARFLIHLHAKNISKAFVQQFTNSDLRTLMLPYFREYVSSTCTRMHIPPILLPFPGQGGGEQGDRR